MSIDTIKQQIPDYAKDIKLNLSSMVNDETLNEQQLWGTLFASGIATGNANLIANIQADAENHLDGAAMTAAQSAAAIMAMNNVYYKFTGFMDEYRGMPPKLRMNVIGNPGVDKADFELWSLAVSIINSCQYCVMAHEKELRNHGMSQEQIQTAIRIAATIRAVDAVMKGEAGHAQADMPMKEAA